MEKALGSTPWPPRPGDRRRCGPARRVRSLRPQFNLAPFDGGCVGHCGVAMNEVRSGARHRGELAGNHRTGGVPNLSNFEHSSSTHRRVTQKPSACLRRSSEVGMLNSKLASHP